MRSISLFALLVVSTSAAPAFADSALTIRTVEGGDWSHTVDELRANGLPQHGVHVEVRDADDQLVRCADYVLSLDAAGARAFFIGDCDPATQTTELCLNDRTFLYNHAEGIAQPILPALVASRPPSPVVTPPVIASCWALVGPQVIDPESGLPKVVAPAGLALSLAPTQANVQTIAFDRGWLVRVLKSAGVVDLSYALVPWHSGGSGRHRGPSMALDVPPGIVRTPLHLRCDHDPLGSMAAGETLVPQRLRTFDSLGAPVTLRRRQSDGELVAQQIIGMAFLSLGTAGTLYAGIPLTVAGGDHGRVRIAGLGVIGGGLALGAAGAAMFFTARTRSTLRNGTRTVSAVAFHPESASLTF